MHLAASLSRQLDSRLVTWLRYAVWMELYTGAVLVDVKEGCYLARRCGKQLMRRHSHAMKLWSAG